MSPSSLLILGVIMFSASFTEGAPSSAVSDCYHPFLARLDAPTTCATSKDCLVSNAVCVYSLQASSHVCCAPAREAVQPSTLELANHYFLKLSFPYSWKTDRNNRTFSQYTSTNLRASLPGCPPASSPSLADGLPLLCNPNDANDIANDVCPQGYACTASATDFTRAPGSPAFLCCAE
ncbi:hypothetical protein PRIPAC_71646 [Pristionchus pacificus]|uniref:Uncharacterized protein n=1 Tax=Pristionchus pacificus TaxID=54126 RepID=A0A2A6BFJ3_PRIPA|nr:hypothetical protein PRIPAC_71646 [Pristionchus pacificus]|eukprot:PDM64649.1 hypothetical protein PRIPAC_52905 [Pristionchus pacificus]